MVATGDRIGRVEDKVDSLEANVDGLHGCVGRIEGVQEQMSKRLDDVHKLLITLITIGVGGLIVAVVSLVLQLVKQ